ncbi:MAG: membrane protein insertase YidC, partial [Ekhidna sp.]|nr:membrane protein insertase YidC [Ekhidna sp.]
MDRNQFIGLILMFALLAVYFTWFAPEPPIPQETIASEEIVTEQPSEPTPLATANPEPTMPDSVLQSLNTQKYGAFAFASTGEENTNIIENDELRIAFTNKGGSIKEILLKNHMDYLGQPFVLVDPSKSSYDMIIDHNGRKINLSELTFRPTISQLGGDTTRLVYELSNGSFSILQEYIIPPTGFEVMYSISGQDLNTVLNPTDIAFVWNHAINRAENNLEDSRYNSNVRYYSASGENDELAERSTDFEEETLGEQIKWVSFKQKFFSAAIIPNSAFKSGYVSQTVDFSDTTSVKNLSMQMQIPYSDFVNGYGGKYYFGTNKYDVLKKVAPEFEENLDMGWGPL